VITIGDGIVLPAEVGVGFVTESGFTTAPAAFVGEL